MAELGAGAGAGAGVGVGRGGNCEQEIPKFSSLQFIIRRQGTQHNGNRPNDTALLHSAEQYLTY